MRATIRTGAMLLLAVATSIAVTGCGGGLDSTGSAAEPRTVRALMTRDPTSLSLIGKTDHNAEIVAFQVTDSLVQYDTEMVLRPRVAESWEFTDGGKTLTFRLRQGVRWHDGRPVTADDVVATVERARDPAVESRSWEPLFRELASVEALDERTVRVRYEVATPELLEGWRVPLVPAHRAESGAELLTGEFAKHPIGCGPFRFLRYRPGEEIVLEANDDYWDGRPRIDRLVFRIFPDQRTGFEALLSGEVDIMTTTPDLWNEARESRHASRLESFAYYRLNVWTVHWNQDGSNPFFTDPRVRRAMSLALDRERFAAKLLHGLARPAATTYHPDLLWTDPEILPRPHDPDEARRLLDEAGWIDTDGDGIRERDGREFRFTLLIPASTQQLNDHLAVWQQQSWAEIGVGAEIEKLEWLLFRERRDAHRFQAAMCGISFTPNPDQFELYHTSAREDGFNFGGFANPELDRLIEQARTVDDPEARRRAYYRLQRRLHDLEPITCLLHLAVPVLHDKRLHGVEPSALDYWRTSRGPRLWHWVDSAEES